MKIKKQELELYENFEELSRKLPKFSDGRVDYSKSNVAIVITVFVKYNNKILLLRRSKKVSQYQEKWNTVAGYFDELKPLYEKFKEELKEELSINQENIKSYRLGKTYNFTDKTLNIRWIIYPAIVEINDDSIIKLDWEHTECVWIDPKDIIKYDTVPNLTLSLKNGLI